MNTKNYELKDQILNELVSIWKKDDNNYTININALSNSLNIDETLIHKSCAEMDIDRVIKHNYDNEGHNYIEIKEYETEPFIKNGGYTSLYKEEEFNRKFKILENDMNYNIRMGVNMKQLYNKFIETVTEFTDHKYMDNDKYDGYLSIECTHGKYSNITILDNLLKKNKYGFSMIENILSRKDNTKLWYVFSLNDEYKDTKHIMSIFHDITLTLETHYFNGDKYSIDILLISNMILKDTNIKSETVYNIGNVMGDDNKTKISIGVNIDDNKNK